MQIAIFLRCTALVKSLVLLTAMNVQGALATENKPVTSALLMIGEGRFQDSLEILEELGAKGDADALLELRDLHADGHFLPTDLEKAQHYFDLAVFTGDERAIWLQAVLNGDLNALKALYDSGFLIAACELTNIDLSLDADCYEGIKAGAAEGYRHSIFALEAFRKDPSAKSLRDKYPFIRVEAELAAISWQQQPDLESLKALINAVKAGSGKSAIDIIREVQNADQENDRLRSKLLKSISPADRSLISSVLESLASGPREGWFDTDWVNNDALGNVFEKGHEALGIAPHYGNAFKSYEKCSRSRNAEVASLCLFSMAFLKQSGGAGLMRQPAEALRLYERSHELGNSAATDSLATIYRVGASGVEIDFKRAAEYSLMAVERGNNYAAYQLALLYKLGLGVDLDLDKAAEYFHIAATKAGDGNASAMLELAQLHESGNIISADLSVALKFYELARDADESRWIGPLSSIMEGRTAAAEGENRVRTQLDSRMTPRPPGRLDPSVNFGKYIVLIVANQSYENLTDLSTPRSDASIIGKVLASRFGAEVEYLFDATRIDLLSALNKYRRELMPTDNFILYYAGHGIYDEELNVGYWQPVDSTADDDYTWIETDRISRTLSGFKSRNALVIADSCYSGSVVRGGDSPIIKTSDSTALLALSAKKTRMAVTSGGLQPVLDATGNSKTSAFASNLADTLSSIEEPTTISAVFAGLRTAVTAETAAWGFEQIPELAPLYKAGHDGGDFILSPNY